jgi:anthranilate phosphoribosyltransferase
MTWSPEEFGLAAVTADELRVSGPAQSAAMIRMVLSGDNGPAGRAVLANAAAALLIVGRVGSLREGVELAGEAIRSGGAWGLLERWRGLHRAESPGEPSIGR